MSTPEIWATVFFFFLCIVSYLIYGARSSSELHDTNSGDLVPLYELEHRSRISAGTCHAVLIRQSGNVYRDLGLFSSASSAIAEASKSFRRAGVDAVRITHSDETSLAAYRSIYNFRGRAEGKKLAGVQIRLVTPALPKPMDFLDMSLGSATHTGGTKWQIQLNYCCQKCASKKIEMPDDRSNDGPVFCKNCGHVFGTFSEVLNVSNQEAEAHVLRLEAERAEVQT